MWRVLLFLGNIWNRSCAHDFITHDENVVLPLEECPQVAIFTPFEVDVRLHDVPETGNSNSHGARPVRLIITMIKWIRTSRLSTQNSHSLARTVRAGGVRASRKGARGGGCSAGGLWLPARQDESQGPRCSGGKEDQVILCVRERERGGGRERLRAR